MTLKQLKEWVNSLPEEFIDFHVVNAEEGEIDEEYTYRLDKPIVVVTVNEESKEILFLNERSDNKNKYEITE